MSDKVRLTRAARSQVRRAQFRLLTADRAEFPSSSAPGVTYTAVVQLDGRVMCNCRGWTMKKAGQPRGCKHTAELIGERATRHDGEYLYVVTEGNA